MLSDKLFLCNCVPVHAINHIPSPVPPSLLQFPCFGALKVIYLQYTRRFPYAICDSYKTSFYLKVPFLLSGFFLQDFCLCG